MSYRKQMAIDVGKRLEQLHEYLEVYWGLVPEWKPEDWQSYPIGKLNFEDDEAFLDILRYLKMKASAGYRMWANSSAPPLSFRRTWKEYAVALQVQLEFVYSRRRKEEKKEHEKTRTSVREPQETQSQSGSMDGSRGGP